MVWTEICFRHKWLIFNACDDLIVFLQGSNLCRGHRKLDGPSLMPMIENIPLVV